MKLTAGSLGAAIALACVAATAADTPDTTRSQGNANSGAAQQGLPAVRDPALSAKPPLQTGEVKEGVGTETGQFDPNAGGGFRGRSTPVGAAGDNKDRKDKAKDSATGGTSGAPLSGATAPRE